MDFFWVCFFWPSIKRWARHLKKAQFPSAGTDGKHKHDKRYCDSWQTAIIKTLKKNIQSDGHSCETAAGEQMNSDWGWKQKAGGQDCESLQLIVFELKKNKRKIRLHFNLIAGGDVAPLQLTQAKTHTHGT